MSTPTINFSNRSMSRIWVYNFCNANPCNYYLTLKTSMPTQSSINQRLHNAVDAPRKTSQWPNSVRLEAPNSLWRSTTKVSGLLLQKVHSLSPDKLKNCSRTTRERYMVTNYVVIRMQNLIQRERHVTCRLISSPQHNPIAGKTQQEWTHMLTTKSANN